MNSFEIRKYFLAVTSSLSHRRLVHPWGTAPELSRRDNTQTCVPHRVDISHRISAMAECDVKLSILLCEVSRGRLLAMFGCWIERKLNGGRPIYPAGCRLRADEGDEAGIPVIPLLKMWARGSLESV
jgi:hypothetical protein